MTKVIMGLALAATVGTIILNPKAFTLLVTTVTGNIERFLRLANGK